MATKRVASAKERGVVIRRRVTPPKVDAVTPAVPAARETPQDLMPSDPGTLPVPLIAAGSPDREIDKTLLSNFTHQIINPLNGVLGTLDNIIDGTVPEHRKLQRLKAVRGQLVGTVELVRNLAYLSQLSTEKGRDGLRAASADVTVPAVIIEAAQFFQESAEQRNINIHLTDRATQYVVKSHSDLLRQVLMNVIENGVKYGDEGSQISITPRPQKSTGHLFVEIVGTGPGFLAEERARIFELGFRGADAQGIRASGSGIGLYVCRQILDLYGASIDAEHSHEQRRTTFRIRFPHFIVAEKRGVPNG